MKTPEYQFPVSEIMQKYPHLMLLMKVLQKFSQNYCIFLPVEQKMVLMCLYNDK